MSQTVTLVLGGARSGKSAWAEQVARESNGPVLYVATAEALDDEMKARIAVHRANRPETWQTVEVADDLLGAVRERARPGAVIVVDCLTLWTSNVIHRQTAQLPDASAVTPGHWRDIETALVAAVEDLVDHSRRNEQALILVSNEVGLGLVPPYPLGRGFRDVLGRVNAAVARRADLVVLMVAGIAVDLKQLSATIALPVSGNPPMGRHLPSADRSNPELGEPGGER